MNAAFNSIYTVLQRKNTAAVLTHVLFGSHHSLSTFKKAMSLVGNAIISLV